MVYKPIFEQVLEQGLKYKSSAIDKRVVPTFFCEGCPEHYIEVPWLNLLTHIPLSRALKGQPEPVWYYIVRKEIYDSQRGEVLPLLRERLKEIFHQSFLFQLSPEQIEYRPFLPYTLTQATLKNWYLQMTVFDFSGQIEEEKLLCLLIHEAWQRIRMPKLHTSVDEAAYDALSYQITYNNQMWTWPTPLPPKSSL